MCWCHTLTRVKHEQTLHQKSRFYKAYYCLKYIIMISLAEVVNSIVKYHYNENHHHQIAKS